MWRYVGRRVTIAVVGFGGFGIYLASIAFAWQVPWWGRGVFAVIVLVIVSCLCLRPRGRRGSSDLYASDGYSDAYLGRSLPTHPHRDPVPVSQVGAPLSPDPITLPEVRSIGSGDGVLGEVPPADSGLRAQRSELLDRCNVAPGHRCTGPGR